jgi:hypothetical protein
MIEFDMIYPFLPFALYLLFFFLFLFFGSFYGIANVFSLIKGTTGASICWLAKDIRLKNKIKRPHPCAK